MKEDQRGKNVRYSQVRAYVERRKAYLEREYKIAKNLHKTDLANKLRNEINFIMFLDEKTAKYHELRKLAVSIQKLFYSFMRKLMF